MAFDKEDILNRWGYHPPTEKTGQKHESLRRTFMEFASYLAEILPDGDAKKTVFKELQNTSMWANFAVAETAPVIAPPELHKQENDEA